ncbi:replication-relaxation family protein [Bacillus pseudomycoides]|uniref:replication-relaxation family protein n=1 Tax=Bacillus pseudomycoides TaxID=64104 RepID=UPI000BEF4314|nr:replication-relaxation family protein [Bacillus pseudomycoides]PEK34093.1 hypothetical protein CN691_12795 [Bacillus pseudomycoides]
MNKRDRCIINDIQKFRVLSRDQIIELYFSNLSNPVSTCNLVLKRLQDRNYIKACKEFRPYLYVPNESKMKSNSQKVFHFLKIADTYIEMKKYDSKLSNVQVEPKYKKGMVEPDLFCIFQNTPFFLEIQLSVYNEKVMNEKIQRYEQFFYSNVWKDFEWQQEGKEIFPIIIMITDTYYDIESDLKILQYPSIEALMKKHSNKNKKDKPTKGLTSKVKSEKETIRIVVK